MRYGLIGEHLGHSFSKEVHAMLSDYEYELREIRPDELDGFMSSKNFKAINVTIPYKEAVIPYLDFVSEEAKKIGAVNTVVNRDEKLFGYNTDFAGMCALINKMRITVKGKKTVILGSGGTSKTAYAVAEHLGADPIITVSRTGKCGAIDYEELASSHRDAEIIINTTPCGMYPDNFASPIDLEGYDRLEGVIDAIYNPLRSSLVVDARSRGVKAEGGLYMLVAQAVFASEIFTGRKYPLEKLNKIYNKIRRKKENIVLIGMPASGKSTISKIIAKELSRERLDTDDMVVESRGMKISDIFQNEGESAFREYETQEIANVSLQNSRVIATGGGIVLNPKNVKMLKQNGMIFFIDRPYEKLLPSIDRPLSSSVEAVKERYNERYDLYRTAADVVIDANDMPFNTARKITGAFYK